MITKYAANILKTSHKNVQRRFNDPIWLSSNLMGKKNKRYKYRTFQRVQCLYQVSIKSYANKLK